MSGLVDLLRDRARLALRGAAEERVTIGAWRRASTRYRDAVDLFAGEANAGVMFPRVEDEELGIVCVEVSLDADRVVAILSATHGEDHPAVAHLRARIARVRASVAPREPEPA